MGNREPSNVEDAKARGVPESIGEIVEGWAAALGRVRAAAASLEASAAAVSGPSPVELRKAAEVRPVPGLVGRGAALLVETERLATRLEAAAGELTRGLGAGAGSNSSGRVG